MFCRLRRGDKLTMFAVLWLSIILVTSSALKDRNTDEQLLSTRNIDNQRSSKLLDAIQAVQRHPVRLTPPPNSAAHRIPRAPTVSPQQLAAAFPSRSRRPQIAHLPSQRREPFAETNQQAIQQFEEQRPQIKVVQQPAKRKNGASYRFCDTFGCDCTPPAKAKCCKGYRLILQLYSIKNKFHNAFVISSFGCDCMPPAKAKCCKGYRLILQLFSIKNKFHNAFVISSFGCDCMPPANAKCCKGYSYDRKNNKCRELL
ncbi:hypothetical protein CDAR_492451 [Caerostris darwini]|uniref:Uncharacterized protein n=1 Tax=Caerostris darwini TaxID=1538125 RepID=A0AAV4UZW4_9ARAC|nr:hypothetical protein CDAR_492451 [Caerostris darwini]